MPTTAQPRPKSILCRRCDDVVSAAPRRKGGWIPVSRSCACNGLAVVADEASVIVFSDPNPFAPQKVWPTDD